MGIDHVTLNIWRSCTNFSDANNLYSPALRSMLYATASASDINGMDSGHNCSNQLLSSVSYPMSHRCRRCPMPPKILKLSGLMTGSEISFVMACDSLGVKSRTFLIADGGIAPL